MANPPKLRKIPSGHGLAAAYKRLSISASKSGASGDTPPKNEANVGRRIARKLVQVVQPSSARQSSQSSSNIQPLVSTRDRYSEAVADWNIVRARIPDISHKDGAPAPLFDRHDHSDTEAYTETVSLANKPLEGSNLAEVSSTAREESYGHHLSENNEFQPLSRLDAKPLPLLPRQDHEFQSANAASSSVADPANTAFVPETIDLGEYRHHLHDSTQSEAALTQVDIPAMIATDGSISHQAHEGGDLAALLGIEDAASISVHRQQAPMVTHTTAATHVHNILSEQITREIHEHHYYHRVLPVTDREVRPARHFVRETDGSLTEIHGSQVAPHLVQRADQAIIDYAQDPGNGDLSWAQAGHVARSYRHRYKAPPEEMHSSEAAGSMPMPASVRDRAAQEQTTRDVFFHFLPDESIHIR